VESDGVIYDYLVIGGGISGASAAYELSATGSVIVIEAETAAGYHSTGRSAALFTRNYGSKIVRAINAASEPFFELPPEGFCEDALLEKRGFLAVAPLGREAQLEKLLDLSTDRAPVHRLTAQQTMDMSPLLRPELVAAGAYEPGVSDIDVASLHQGYLRGLKQRGGHVHLGHRIDGMRHTKDGWTVTAKNQTINARTVVNATGAWADEVGQMAGAAPIGLVPKRRTGIIVDVPTNMDLSKMPATEFIGEDAYLKPDSGKLMASPGDETPVAPQDIRPDEMDMAILVDWLQRNTTLNVNRIAHSWAGLRCFVADGDPVVGFDSHVPDFFWLAGQGGYGIMMAPALARATVRLITDNALPDDLIQSGLRAEDVSPARCASHPGSDQIADTKNPLASEMSQIS
jgi:D-arginine dehydrogenase